ncbi:MAG: YqcC family protein [Methylophilaceae bacterium]
MGILNLFKKKGEKVSAIINEIELEMKSIGFWSNNPPDFEASNFTEAPSFELWLQCVFIPNVKDAISKGSYPKQSQVGLMAMREYDHHSHVEVAQNLISLLNKFDEVIEGSWR